MCVCARLCERLCGLVVCVCGLSFCAGVCACVQGWGMGRSLGAHASPRSFATIRSTLTRSLRLLITCGEARYGGRGAAFYHLWGGAGDGAGEGEKVR